MGHASQSLIKRDPKSLFKGNLKRDRALGGESKSLPRLIRKGFDGDQATLPLAREIGVGMPLKACDNKDLRDKGQNWGWREESLKNAVWMGIGCTGRWRKPRLFVCITSS